MADLETPQAVPCSERKQVLCSERKLGVHEHFMRVAMREAELAETAGEVPTGCVIVERPEDGTLTADARIIGHRSRPRKLRRQRADTIRAPGA